MKSNSQKWKMACMMKLQTETKQLIGDDICRKFVQKSVILAKSEKKNS